MKNKQRGGKKHKAEGDSSKESTIICYECEKPGHIKAECSLIKKRGKKDKCKRAMTAMTWSDDEESGSEEEVKSIEVANLCLMTHEEKNEVSTSMNYKILLMT